MVIREILIRCVVKKNGEKSGEISQYFCVQPWALKAETEVECDVLGL